MTRRTNLRRLRWRWPARLALAGFLFASFALPLLAGPAAADEAPTGASYAHHSAPVESAEHHGQDHGAAVDHEMPADLPSDPGCNLCKSCAFCVVALPASPSVSIPTDRAAKDVPPPTPGAAGISPSPLPEPPRS